MRTLWLTPNFVSQRKYTDFGVAANKSSLERFSIFILKRFFPLGKPIFFGRVIVARNVGAAFLPVRVLVHDNPNWFLL